MYFVATPAVVVMLALVPVKRATSVAVTVVAVPEAVCVVKVIVAIPLAFVLLVAAENDPFTSDLVHVTTLPAVLTALLCASTSCAVMVTLLPAAGVVLLEVTM